MYRNARTSCALERADLRITPIDASLHGILAVILEGERCVHVCLFALERHVCHPVDAA